MRDFFLNFRIHLKKKMEIINSSNGVEDKSAFTQWEHNIVAGYLIIAGKMNDTQTLSILFLKIDRLGFCGISLSVNHIT